MLIQLQLEKLDVRQRKVLDAPPVLWSMEWT